MSISEFHFFPALHAPCENIQLVRYFIRSAWAEYLRKILEQTIVFTGRESDSDHQPELFCSVLPELHCQANRAALTDSLGVGKTKEEKEEKGLASSLNIAEKTVGNTQVRNESN